MTFQQAIEEITTWEAENFAKPESYEAVANDDFRQAVEEQGAEIDNHEADKAIVAAVLFEIPDTPDSINPMNAKSTGEFDRLSAKYEKWARSEIKAQLIAHLASMTPNRSIAQRIAAVIANGSDISENNFSSRDKYEAVLAAEKGFDAAMRSIEENEAHRAYWNKLASYEAY